MDELQSKGYRIYPVPSKGVFTISVPAIPGKTCNIKVCSNLGQVIFEKTMISSANTFTGTIDFRPVPAGIYTILLQTVEGPVTGKLLILQ